MRYVRANAHRGVRARSVPGLPSFPVPLSLACALLVGGCSDPGAVEDHRPETVVFGPATIAFNAPDLEQVGPWQALSTGADGRFHWTFERQVTRSLYDLSHGAVGDTVTAVHPALSIGEELDALPFNTLRASMHGGELVVIVRNDLGFDLEVPDSSAIATQVTVPPR